jgi:hypothetical protein
MSFVGMFDLRLRFHPGLRLSLRFVNRPDHIERALRVILEFVAQDSLATV